MIRYALGMMLRGIVELGLVFVLAGVTLVFVAYRLGRLFVTSEPDRIDKLAAQLGTLLGRAAVAQRAAAAELDDAERPADPGVDQADFYGEIDWRELVV